MPWVPGPFSFMVGEWLLRNGVPLVTSRFIRSAPSTRILFEGQARLEHGPENVSGLLSLTPSDLVFTPSGFRTRNAQITLPLAEIDDVVATKARFLGLIPVKDNGIKVRSRRGIFRFRVDPEDRDDWLREIRTARAMAQPPAPLPPFEGNGAS